MKAFGEIKIIGIIILIFLSSLGLWIFSRIHFPVSVQESILSELQRCPLDTQASRPCIQKQIEALLAHEDATHVMQDLNAHFPSAICHTMGHVVGQLVYDRSPSIEAAYASCSTACGGSCTHGITGEALRTVSGINLSLDELSHPNLNLILTEAKKLCITGATCHAVGHVVYQIYQNLDKALAFCDQVGSACASGVFMENFSSEMSLDQIYPERKYRSDSDLLYPCDAVGQKYRPACYVFLFTRQQQEVALKHMNVTDPIRALQLERDACLSVPSDIDRSSCMLGIGYGTLLLPVDLPMSGVRSLCDTGTSFSERAACVSGFVMALNGNGRSTDAIAYCAATGDVAAKENCYQSTFEVALRLRGSKSDIQPGIDEISHICDTTQDQDCAQSLSAFKVRYSDRSTLNDLLLIKNGD